MERSLRFGRVVLDLADENRNDVARATSKNDFRSADVLGIKARSA
jgi:hypothetical protein